MQVDQIQPDTDNDPINVGTVVRQTNDATKSEHNLDVIDAGDNQRRLTKS